MAFYPHKQTIVIFVIAVLAVGGAGAYAFVYSAPATSGENTSLDYAPAPQDPIRSKNSDWREDFISISATSSLLASKTAKITSPIKENLTATDILGRQFFEKYAQLKQADLQGNSEAIDNVVSDLISSSVANLPKPIVYTSSDIRVSKVNNTDTLKAYGTIVTRAIEEGLPDRDSNEAVIAQRALEQGDMGLLAEIDPVITDYKKLRDTLMGTAAPVSLAQYHLDLLNGVSIALYNAESFRKMDVDPTRGLAAIGLEITGLETMRAALAGIREYFISMGVPFGY